MNPRMSELQPYPFQRLKQLFGGISQPQGLDEIALSIGEPKHPAPHFVLDALNQAQVQFENYPSVLGEAALRQAIKDWLVARFSLDAQSLDIDHHILPCNGTREALFAMVQALFDSSNADKPLVMMPNPFYQIYEGAALLAGGQPEFIQCTSSTEFLPDFESVTEQTWQKTQILFICTPGNPTGAVLQLEQLEALIKLSEQYNFIIASDECYSEIYFNEAHPPMGLLEACAKLGRTNYRNCLVFHSLSKRSNVPGMRSGFIAGDQALISEFYRYRTYHGCAMPGPIQQASIAAWKDENHVEQGRALYGEKFRKFKQILAGKLELSLPDAGFYFWAKVPETFATSELNADERFAQLLWEKQAIKVLPGTYLSRSTAQGNPGAGYVRMALVATLQECELAAHRIAELLEEQAQ